MAKAMTEQQKGQGENVQRGDERKKTATSVAKTRTGRKTYENVRG